MTYLSHSRSACSRGDARPLCRAISCAVVCALCAFVPMALAQSPITFQYFYDDLNQLVRVVDSTGVVVEYAYDSVGNILQINRSNVTPGALAIFSATPQTIATGGTITIQGQGFSTTP